MAAEKGILGYHFTVADYADIMESEEHAELMKAPVPLTISFPEFLEAGAKGTTQSQQLPSGWAQLFNAHHGCSIPATDDMKPRDLTRDVWDEQVDYVCLCKQCKAVYRCALDN
jgi:hypothetical protein